MSRGETRLESGDIHVSGETSRDMHVVEMVLYPGRREPRPCCVVSCVVVFELRVTTTLPRAKETQQCNHIRPTAARGPPAQS